MTDDFELGREDEMEPASSVTFSTLLRLHYYIYFNFFKWPIVLLDKTLIYRLVSFIALWSSTETVILTFNRLESIETNYMDTNPGFHQKP